MCIATVEQSRAILNRLIFDPDGISWCKTDEAMRFSEEKVIELYWEVIKDTKYMNFDELVIRAIWYNESIMHKAVISMIEESPYLADEFICDTTKIYNEIIRNEVSIRDTLPDYICRILNQHGLSYIPFMESKYERPVEAAFGIEGICVVNDCQNSLIDVCEGMSLSCVGLSEVQLSRCNVVRTAMSEDRRVLSA